MALTFLLVVVEMFLTLFVLAAASPGTLLSFLTIAALPAIWWYPRRLPRSKRSDE